MSMALSRSCDRDRVQWSALRPAEAGRYDSRVPRPFQPAAGSSGGGALLPELAGGRPIRQSYPPTGTVTAGAIRNGAGMYSHVLVNTAVNLSLFCRDRSDAPPARSHGHPRVERR